MTDSVSTNESKPTSEDVWKISGDEVSEDICPDNNYMNEKLKRLDEHYALQQAINIWHGPQIPAFNSLIARVKSFEGADWPETRPKPISLAEAGFFLDKWTNHSVCFYCNGCLVDCLPQDKPFHEHGYWFPDCVYVRYLKGPSFYQEFLKYHKERHITTDKVVIQTTTTAPHECCLRP